MPDDRVGSQAYEYKKMTVSHSFAAQYPTNDILIYLHWKGIILKENTKMVVK